MAKKKVEEAPQLDDEPVGIVEPMMLSTFSINPDAPNLGGDIRKPKDWEPEHVHLPVSAVAYVSDVTFIGDLWNVVVSFNSEADATKFKASLQ